MAKGRRVIVGISVPPDLRARMLESKGRNWSMICREAIERALDGSLSEIARTLELREAKERLRKIRDLASG